MHIFPIQINFESAIFPFTPLLNDRFTEYLGKCFFKDFTPGKFDEPLGRHTLAHGTSKEQSFNKKIAILSFLMIDQLYYILGADGNFRSYHERIK